MKPISEVEVLQRNYEWFVLERHPFSITAEGSCRYGEPGSDLRCAIGCVLPPEIDTAWLDEGSGKPIQLAQRDLRHMDLVQLFSECRSVFLTVIQAVHDQVARDVLIGHLTLAEGQAVYTEKLAKLASDLAIDWQPSVPAEGWPQVVAPIPSVLTAA